MIVYEDGEQFNVPSKWLADHDKQIKDEVIQKIYDIVISDITDKDKVLKIQDYIFNIKGIDNCESERI